MAGPKRRVLLVVQLAPPSPLVAARRTAGLTKYLGRLGIEVTVLTSRISGEGEIEGAARVARVPDLMATPLNWRRDNFQALEGSPGGSYRDASRLEAVLFPDVAAATWLPLAVVHALRLARRERFDCVITSSPPHSVHLIGRALGRRGFPWIAEFRDGWTFDRPPGKWSFGWQDQAERRLERGVVTRADAIVGVTKPIAKDLASRFGVDPVVITNGYDPEERPSNELDGLLDERRHSLVYTGRLAHAGRTPTPLFDGLRHLRKSHPGSAQRLEIVFAGPLSEEEEVLFSAPDLRESVRAIGTLDRGRTLALQRAADSLLVIAKGSGGPSVATAKLFEYLGAGRPILVLGEETAAATIVEDTAAGIVTSASDPEAIADALQRLVSDPPAGVENGVSSRYGYPVLAEQYAQLIETVVG